MSMLPKAIYIFNAISKSSVIFHRNRQKHLKMYMEHHKTLNTQRNLGKDTAGGIITLPDFKLFYKAIETKTLCIDIK